MPEPETYEFTEEEAKHWGQLYALITNPEKAPAWESLTDDAQLVWMIGMLEIIAPMVRGVLSAVSRTEKHARAKRN